MAVKGLGSLGEAGGVCTVDGGTRRATDERWKGGQSKGRSVLCTKRATGKSLPGNRQEAKVKVEPRWRVEGSAGWDPLVATARATRAS